MVIAKKWPSNRGPRCAIKPQCDSPWVGRPDAPVPLAWVAVSRIRSFLATWIGRAMSLRISTYRMIVSIRVAPPAGATSTALWPYSASKRKGLAALRPLTPRRSWLRRSDLNRRPLGYEGKSALHTDQREPTGTNGDGDLRGERAVPCRFFRFPRRRY